MSRGLLCFGNPLIDSYAFVEDAFLEKNKLIKGSNAILTKEEISNITKDLEFVFIDCGGSSSNVARGIGILGYRVGLVGQYGDDETGKIVEKSLKSCNVENLSFVKPGGITTQVVACITSDAQRTMFAIFGASHEEYIKPFDLEILNDWEGILLEGYHFCNASLNGLAQKVAHKAKELNKKTILIISSIFQVPGYKENLLQAINCFSIVTGTSEEFMQLFDKNDIEEMLEYLEKSNFELAAVTLGKEGSYIIYKGKRMFVNAPAVENVVDTTGAGDCFAAGLLFGYFSGYPLEKSIEIANIMAGQAISKIGVCLNDEVKEKVRNKLVR
ncbi:2-dehydro-3-deoxygluconokinase [Candidatus Mycoplasma haematohominis]|uniref:2-dehydro-3-deoxygluconokinase n=1 Tax=Candidatus Mycoplasma haematohominis TaxID=1494318 RepID=A0A478FQF8_9MOLU|nr:2-dehydro-3-deoxygluconokinase [Candidatus Mycoplasma haemohominis]